MNNKLIKLILFKLSLTFFLLLSFLLLKQTFFSAIEVWAVEDQIVNSSAQLVYNQESLNQDIRQLKIRYRSELEEYRQLENEHVLAQKQYQQLKTLTSLEKSLRATQKLLESRDKILNTYLRLLRLSLLSQPGINIVDKQLVEKKLIELATTIELHQAQLIKDFDRSGLAIQIENFNQQAPTIEQTANHAILLLNLGRLQTIQDQAQILKTELEPHISSQASQLKLEQQQRSFVETQQSLDELTMMFDEIEGKIAQPGSGGYKASYRNLQESFQHVYSRLFKIISFLEELLTL